MKNKGSRFNKCFWNKQIFKLNFKLLCSLLLVLFLNFGNLLHAQLNKDIFPLDRQFKKWGFYAAPELNYLIPSAKTSHHLTDKTGNYNFETEGSGKLGYGIELGGFYNFSNLVFIDYIEAGIGYRKFNGAATHKGTLNDTSNFYSENTLGLPLVVASIRATNVRQLGKHSFWTNSFGLNFNYFFSEKYIRSNPYPLRFESFIESPNLQIHYQIGIGFRVSKKLLVIPSVETPLFDVIPFDGVKTGFKFFSHGYQPLIFKIRFLLLQEDPVNCNAPRFDGPQPGF